MKEFNMKGLISFLSSRGYNFIEEDIVNAYQARGINGVKTYFERIGIPTLFVNKFVVKEIPVSNFKEKNKEYLSKISKPRKNRDEIYALSRNQTLRSVQFSPNSVVTETWEDVINS